LHLQQQQEQQGEQQEQQQEELLLQQQHQHQQWGQNDHKPLQLAAKSKLLSAVSSTKNETLGHSFRLEVMAYVALRSLQTSRKTVTLLAGSCSSRRT
jgi:hypothetical protein